MPERAYSSIEAYYTDVPGARRSGEVDFGVWWFDAEREPWRVSWVRATGDVYAVRTNGGQVIVLGNMSNRRELEQRLDGWAEVCGKPHSLDWVRKRLAAGGVHA